MGLKALIKAADYEGLDDTLKALYVQSGDNSEEYVLDVDEKGFKERLGEFRTSNITLKTEREKLEKKLEAFKDVDPAKYNEMKKKLDELEDADLMNEKKFEELLDKRVERMRQEFEGQVTALTARAEGAEKERDTLNDTLSTVLIDSEVQKAVSEVGAVRKGAMDDLLGRARKTWMLVDGKPTPMNGDSVRFGKDGKSPLSMKEWAESQLVEAPFLFEGNKGGEGPGNDGNGTQGGVKTIQAGDRKGFAANIADIASGKVKVSMDSPR